MNSDAPASFDLIDEPWLMARTLEGATTELGILPLLEQAHQLAGLTGEVPTQVFALTRLLLAVLHGAVTGPADLDEWGQLWEADALPAARIADYLHGHRDRFDLFHPDTPFLQVAGLRTAKDETFALTKLVADLPNGVPFFTTRRTTGLELSYAEAARWLVHCHAFDPSGIKSGAVGDKRVKNGKGYPIGVAWSGQLGGVLLEGATLKQTLLLNLMARDFASYTRDHAQDRPAWERDPVGPAEEIDGGRHPSGPVDLYTWQSRRVRLVAARGKVTSVLIANGERLTPQNMHGVEPHTAWRRSMPQEKKLGSSTPVYMPREHDPDKAIWRGLQSLLPGSSSRQGGSGADPLAPGILEWLSYLGNEQVIDPDQHVHIRAVGMVYGSNSSITDDIVYDTLAFRAALANRDAEDLAGIVTSCVHAADHAARCVGNLAGDLVAAAGGDGAGPRSRILEQVYAQLDSPFRAWLLTLRAGADEVALRTDWHQQAFQVAREVARELLTNVPPACWHGRVVRDRVLTAAHAEARYWKDLRVALPFAFREDNQLTTVAARTDQGGPS